MSRRGRKTAALMTILTITMAGWATLVSAEPRNIILLIGDGMGFAHVEAGECYAGSPLSFESFPYQGDVMTHSADSDVTDSAAAATAIATGIKVNNGVISMAYPGDGSELATILEYAMGKGKSAGLVTTTYITHATPAAFAAHEPSRNNTSEIADDYLTQTLPHLLLGGGGYGMSPASAQAAGYTVVEDAAGLFALDTETATMVSGQFGTDHMPYEYDGLGDYPHLSDMTEVALQILDNDPDGFFLMVEGGRIDHAAHANAIVLLTHEMIEFDNAVNKAIAWASGRDDTLILVTSDHETGGLTVTEDNGPGQYPTVHWGSQDHTGVNVPAYAWGINAHLVNGTMDNTYMTEIMVGSEATDPVPADGATDVAVDVVLEWTSGPTAMTHDVYLGTDPQAVADADHSSPEFMGNQTGNTFDPPELQVATPYYWSVDAVDSNNGVLPGAVWSFTTRPNSAPVAVDDAADTDEDTAVAIAVLANDSDPDGHTLTVESITQPANGDAAVDPEGIVTYQADADFYGSDAFTYTISDGNGGTDTAAVNVTIAPVNDPPVADNQMCNTDEDQPLAITLTASDVEGDPLTYAIVDDPTLGSLSGAAPNLTYTPDPDVSGSDSFTFRANDGAADSNPATVTIDIAPVNDPPVAHDDSAMTDEDTAVVVDVLANDTDVDAGDTLAVDSVTQPANGTATLNPDDTVTYTPAAGFNGNDTFTYTARDGADLTDTAVVTVQVNRVNTAPVANDDTAGTDEDTAVAVAVLANDTDADGDPLAVESVAQPANGAAAINADDTITYTPNANYHGPDSFTYTINDGFGGTDSATVNVSVNPVNDAPVAQDDGAVTDEDTPVAIDVLANDTDADGDALSVVSVTDPANGTATINPDQTVTYTPDSGFNGNDTFTYTANDGTADSNVAGVTVDVLPTHALATSANPVEGGSVARNPDLAKYDDGAIVELTAASSVGWRFTGWSGDASGTENPISVTMDGDKSVVANFEAIPQYTLDTTVSPDGSGSIARSPDQSTYDEGTPVELTATASPGYQFVEWSGDLTGTNNPATIIMDADKSVTASFELLPTWNDDVATTETATEGVLGGTYVDTQTENDICETLTEALTNHGSKGYDTLEHSWTVSLSNNGPATVFLDAYRSGPGVDLFDFYYSTDGVDFTYMLTVTKTADDDVYQTYSLPDGTTGDVMIRVVDTDSTLKAFEEDILHVDHLFIRSEVLGQKYALTTEVSPADSGGVWRNPDQTEYLEGTQVELTAVAATGYRFDSWSGDATGTANPVTITMDAAKNVVANFVPVPQHTLATGVDPSDAGSIDRSPDLASYDEGSEVQLTAVAEIGYVFDQWSGDASGTANPITITMDTDKSVTAHFVAAPEYTLTVDVSPAEGGTVSRNPDQSTYYAGAEVELTATPNGGWRFDHWEGDAAGPSNPLTVTMDGNKTITAVFVPDTVVNAFVHDITMGADQHGKNYMANATVWIKDTGGNDVAGATVTGNWSGADSGTASGTTDDTGRVILYSANIKEGGTFTFTVTSVEVADTPYDPSLNTETSDTITAP